MSKRERKYMKGFTFVITLAVVMLSIGLLYLGFSTVGASTTTIPSSSGGDSSAGSGTTNLAGCPDNLVTAVTLNIYNPLNTTGTGNYDAEVTFTTASGKKVVGTDSTDGAYNLSCGEEWKLTQEAADGAGGDGSKIRKVLEGDGKLNADGTVSFTPRGSVHRLTVATPQHGILEFRAYDKENNRYAYNTSQNTNTAWFGDGVTFRNGGNSTAFALSAAGDFLNFDISVRTVGIFHEFCDHYCLIAIEAPVTEYDEPIVSMNGVVLSDIKGSGLNAYEVKQLSAKEYVYKYEGEIKRKASTLGFYIEANANPTSDIEIDFLAAGKLDSINGVDILTSAALDDSAATVLYAIMDTTIDVS